MSEPQITPMSVSREECEAVLAHCLITKNMCGTDTWAVGKPCPCWRCQNYLKVSIHGLAQAHIALLDTQAKEKEEAVAAERERCAKIADNQGSWCLPEFDYDAGFAESGKQIAAKIRSGK